MFPNSIFYLGDVICKLGDKDVRGVSHINLVDMLRELPVGFHGRLTIRRDNMKHR